MNNETIDVLSRNDINLQNKSSKTKIKISVGQVEPDIIALPDVGSIEIEPEKSLKIPKFFEGGSAKLFVWNDSNTLKWCGLIPLGGISPIEIYPDGTSAVKYRGQEVPSCASLAKIVREDYVAVEDSSNNVPKSRIKLFMHLTTRWYWYLILGFVVILILYLIYLSSKERHKKKL